MFEGDRLSIQAGKNSKKGTYTIDAKKTPKTIDLSETPFLYITGPVSEATT